MEVEGEGKILDMLEIFTCGAKRYIMGE